MNWQGRAQVVVILAVVALVFACARNEASAEASIQPAELAARITSGTAPIILDVRTPDEFASGHIEGAVNIPLDELPSRLATAKLSPTEEIVVHCQRGPRAAKAEKILRESGYTHVRDLVGHMEAWRADGYPVD